MVTVNPPVITVVEAGATVTSTQQVLTTINWSVSQTSLPSTGGTVTFTITALDQSNNPIAGVTGITLNEGNIAVGTFPATNAQGQSQLGLGIPANTSTSQITYVFTLTGY